MQSNEILEKLKEIKKQTPWRFPVELDNLIKEIERKGNKSMTRTQQNSLHLGLTFVAKHLNEIGKDMRVVLKPTVEIWWSLESAKEYLFRPIMKAHTTKESTTKLTKHEVSECWDIMFKFLGEKHGVEYIPFPNRTEEKEAEEKQLDKSLQEKYSDVEADKITAF